MVGNKTSEKVRAVRRREARVGARLSYTGIATYDAMGAYPR